MDLLRMQTRLQNSPHKCEFSYYTIDGFEWEGFPSESESGDCSQIPGLLIIPVSDPLAEIVLASDGYPRLFPSLAETEAFLAKLLEEDPLCYKQYRSTKGRYAGNISFDDRAYLRFQI